MGAGTIQGVAQKLGVIGGWCGRHWRARFLRNGKAGTTTMPKSGAGDGFHRRDFDCGRGAPKKQRHTARRIWQRIRQEHPQSSVGEATVRRYVQRRKEELGQVRRELSFRRSTTGGRSAGGLVRGDGRDGRGDAQGVLFSMRSMASGGAFHVAYYHATQQAFLEAHELAFRYFGGVFRLLRYDNLKSAVKKILRGQQREETERLIAFRSHWGFQTEFCNPARGNEKGGVEGELGYFRRNYFVPVPRVQDLAELNALLLQGCQQDQQRKIAGKAMPVPAFLPVRNKLIYLTPVAKAERAN